MNFSDVGAPLLSTSRKGCPVSLAASSSGLAIVAELQMNFGDAPIELADAEKSAQYVCQVASEHSAVLVQLVDHDIAKILEKPHPARVMRQDTRVEHVRVGHHNVAGRAHGPSRIRRRITVVGVRLDVHVQVCLPAPRARGADPEQAPW